MPPGNVDANRQRAGQSNEQIAQTARVHVRSLLESVWMERIGTSVCRRRPSLRARKVALQAACLRSLARRFLMRGRPGVRKSFGAGRSIDASALVTEKFTKPRKSLRTAECRLCLKFAGRRARTAAENRPAARCGFATPLENWTRRIVAIILWPGRYVPVCVDLCQLGER